MRLKIQFMVPVFQCALILVGSSYGAEDLAEQIKQAERLCVKRQFTDAEQIYLNIIQQATDAEQRFSAQRKLAAVLVAQDKQPLAMTLVQNMLSDYAQHERLPHAIHEIAESCQKFGKAAKAKEIYEAILKDQPGNPQKIWLDMGLAISNILAGEQDAATAITDRLLNEYRADDRAAEAVGQVAWCYRKQKDFQNARTLYQHVVDTWPDNERAIYSQRGIILTSVELKDPNSEKGAIDRLFRDYSRHKDFVNVVSYVAEVYREKRQFKESRDLHQYIVDKYPASDQAIWSQRSIILSSIGLMDDPNAEAGISRLLADFGEHKEISTTVYQIARKLNYRKGSRAKELYEYVRDRNRDDRYTMLAQVNIGSLTLWAGDPKGARAVFDGVLEQHKAHPQLSEAVHLMAEAYWEQAAVARAQGQEEEYRVSLQRALCEWNRNVQELPETEYHTAAACFFSGECYRKLDQPAQAMERYQRLAERWPGSAYSPRALLTICQCAEKLMESRQIPEAHGVKLLREACQKILDYHADSPAAGRARTILKQWEPFDSENTKMAKMIQEWREKNGK